MLSALLFDLDGTLANTDPVHFENWRSILQEYGIEIDRNLYRQRFSGRRNDQIVADFLPQLSPEAGEALSWRKEAEFRQQAEHLPPMPGLAEILDWAEQRQLKKAVVTNAPPENVEFMLRVLQLEAVFPIVILGDRLPKGKPDPLPYQTALEQLGVAANETVAFEDSPSGIQSAVAAGIPTVGIASTQEPDVIQALGVDLVVPDFSDRTLWSWLEQRLGASLTTDGMRAFR